MRKPVKYSLYITATVLILAVFFVFGLPAMLKGVLESQITKNFHRQASIESVSFNPFKLLLTLQGVTIRNQVSGAVFVSLDQVRVNTEIVSVLEGGGSLERSDFSESLFPLSPDRGKCL